MDATSDAKSKTRKAIDRALLRAVPGYKGYRAARDSFLKKHSTLCREEIAAYARNGLVADISDAVLSHDLDYYSFGPPYELFDVSTIDLGYPDDMITHNGSFVEPQNGILFNDIRFRQSEDGWLPGAYNPGGRAWTRVAAGINYRVPATNYLTCGVVLRNLYNHFAYAVTDNFGFSYADLEIVQSIFIEIVRPSGEIALFAKILMQNGLISHGSELSNSESPIPSFIPITLGFTTRDAFLKGERIQILVGSRIYISTDLDDMNAFGDATLTWQLLSIGVRV